MKNDYRSFVMKLSQYRTQIMGFSILWIVLFHAQSNEIIRNRIPFLSCFFDFGYGGVDLFIFLSGFGLYHAFSRNRNLTRFYYRRMKRVLPLYLLSIIFLATVFNFSNIPIFSIAFSIKVFKSFWFMPFIILLYLIYPFFHVYWKKLPYISVVYLIVIIAFFIFWKDYGYINMMLTRIPVFVLGIYFAILHIKESYANTYLCILAFVVGSCLLAVTKFSETQILNLYGMNRLAFLLLTPFLCYLIASLASFKSISYILKFIGTYSLELYLGHGFARFYMRNIGRWDFLSFCFYSILFTACLVIINRIIMKGFDAMEVRLKVND